MSLFWDLLQDHRYFKERDRSDNLERRVQRLETELTELNDLLKKLLYGLETRFNEDLNEDGAVGKPKSRSHKLPPKWKPIKLKQKMSTINDKQIQVANQKSATNKRKKNVEQ